MAEVPFHHALGKLSPPQITGLGILGIGLIGVADALTGFEISLSLFYVGPVALASWYASKKTGLVVALLAAGTWLAADLIAGHEYSHPAIPAWNSLVRLGFFILAAILVSTLEARHALEQRLACTDAVTGLLNRRAFTEQLEYGLALATRGEQAVTLAYLDLDDFKIVNDTLGHSEGDRLLRLVARAIRESTRRTDVAARLGGDEFALLLPATDRAGAESVIDKMRRSLTETLDPDGPVVTCSIGAVTFRNPPGSVDEALRAADALMYRVKARGKNAVAFEEIESPVDVAAPRHLRRHPPDTPPTPVRHSRADLEDPVK